MHLVIFTVRGSADCETALAVLADRWLDVRFERCDLASCPDGMQDLQDRLRRAGQPAGVARIRLPQVFREFGDERGSDHIGGLCALQAYLAQQLEKKRQTADDGGPERRTRLCRAAGDHPLAAAAHNDAPPG